MEGSGVGKRKNKLNFSSDQCLWLINLTDCLACPEQGAGNDPDALGIAFYHQGPTFINSYFM